MTNQCFALIFFRPHFFPHWADLVLGARFESSKARVFPPRSTGGLRQVPLTLHISPISCSSWVFLGNCQRVFKTGLKIWKTIYRCLSRCVRGLLFYLTLYLLSAPQNWMQPPEATLHRSGCWKAPVRKRRDRMWDFCKWDSCHWGQQHGRIRKIELCTSVELPTLILDKTEKLRERHSHAVGQWLHRWIGRRKFSLQLDY